MADTVSALLSSARLKVADAAGSDSRLGRAFRGPCRHHPDRDGGGAGGGKIRPADALRRGRHADGPMREPERERPRLPENVHRRGAGGAGRTGREAPLPGAARTGASCPFFREMRVVRTEAVTPLMRRVVLAGDAPILTRQTPCMCACTFPPAGRAPVWPHAGPDGRMVWPPAPDTLGRASIRCAA